MAQKKNLLVPQCTVKTLTIVKAVGQAVPHQEPLVPAENCPPPRSQVNLESLGCGDYPRPLQDTLYVVIKQNGEVKQRAGEAYASLLLTDEGQALLAHNGYLPIRP